MKNGSGDRGLPGRIQDTLFEQVQRAAIRGIAVNVADFEQQLAVGGV